MKKHANTLYVTKQGCYIIKKGEALAVQFEKKTLLSVPIHTLEGVVCFGRIGVSPFALGLCGEHQVSVAFLTEYGRLLSRMSGPQSGNILLRKNQFRYAESQEQTASIARCFITGKITNARSVLLRSVRDHRDSVDVEKINKVVRRLGVILDHLWSDCPLTLNLIRGIEGEAAHLYFSVFDELIRAQKEDFYFHERSRRPPLDNVNALLSFVYSLLTNDVKTACEAVGLDPQMGFLHTDRSGRPSLALDLMEELRPLFADRLVLALINRRQVSTSGFETRESGSVIMNDKTRKIVIKAYQDRKNETVKHPFLNETISFGLVPHIQARLLARHFRGDLDLYPPFMIR